MEFPPDMDVEHLPETQEQHQPTPSPPPREHNASLWGYLQRYPDNRLVPLPRYDLHKNCPVVTIGRDPRNTICIPHTTMSAFHATIRWGGVQNGVSQVTIEDHGSTNKTFVEGTKVKANTPRTLKDKAEISFASAQIPPPGNTTMQDFRFIYYDLASPVRGVLENYRLESKTGSGNFSKVYKAYDKEDNLFAVKSIRALKSLKIMWNKDGDTVTDQQIDVQREIDMMKSLQHPNICRLLEHFWNADGSFDLVLDFMEGGDLYDFVALHNGLSERMTKHLMRQLCEALAFIHSKNVSHRDLKCENVLLTKNKPPVLKIADFGLAKMVDYNARFESICGTPMYLAPEVALHRFYGTGYGLPADCFSAGGIAYNCITFLRPIFSDMPEGSCLMEHVTPDRTIDWHTLEYKVIETDREGYSVYLSSPGRRFIRGLMEEDPIQRFTMAQALEHEWFQFDQADSYTPPPPTTTDTDGDACEALTSSFEEVTMQTMAPVDVERNATIIPARVGLSPPQPQGSEAAPGLTRLENKGRALKRARQSEQPSPEMLQNLSAQVAAPTSVGASSPSSMEASTPDSVEACSAAEAGPSALGGNNKRKYAALTPPSPLNAHIHSTASSESSFDLEPAMKKGKSRNPDKMDVSPKKLRRRVGQ